MNIKPNKWYLVPTFEKRKQFVSEVTRIAYSVKVHGRFRATIIPQYILEADTIVAALRYNSKTLRVNYKSSYNPQYDGNLETYESDKVINKYITNKLNKEIPQLKEKYKCKTKLI